jgi:hypothetical protein
MQVCSRSVVLGACLCLRLLLPASSRKLVNGLQCLIAKGRLKKNRAALVREAGTVNQVRHTLLTLWHLAVQEGNFGPVAAEVHASDLPIEGTMPKELRGCYMRNGSNPLIGACSGRQLLCSAGATCQACARCCTPACACACRSCGLCALV